MKSSIASAVVMMLLIAAESLQAQNVGKVSGVVKDAQTGEPLIGCNISIVGTTLGASTNIDGEYFILNIPPGKYDIQASMIGYQRVLQSGTIVNAGRTTAADFRLFSEALAQQEVIVQATRPDVEPEKTSTSVIIRHEEVQALAGMRDVGDVLGLAADITDGHFRGGRSGEEYYTLQGMGIVNPLNNTSAFLPIMSAVEEVEVITSGFGAQYGNAQSGVVNISMKEGRHDVWKTRVEGRFRGPGRKHFGPSAYDPASQPYLGLLLDMQTWLRGDPASSTASPYYQSMGSGLRDRYARDTVVQLAVARTLWQMQTKRDLHRTYGNEIDHSIEIATGGPIAERVRLFLALKTDNQWPMFPTEEPDMQRQVMGNIATDLGDGATLRISGGYTQENSSLFPSANSLGYRDWLWDRITAINYQKRTNLQIGARFTHTLSQRTFYEIKINSLITRRKVGSTPTPSSVPDSIVLNPNYRINWSLVLPIPNTSPDQFDYLIGDDIFRDELTRTISLDASVTSQATNSHLLNAGIQFNAYMIDVANALQVRDGSGGPIEQYVARPFEGAFYVQDKMEFEGLIANIGLRWDVWSSERDAYENIFIPYRVTDTSGISRNDPAAAPRKKAPLLGRLQPRAGVSFPLSTSTVFHLNYGSFMQRPSFQYVVSSRVQQGTLEPRILGNPRLEPETTNSYDIGVTQGLGDGFTLDVSGYYKDVKNLVEQAVFVTTQGTSYSTYFNRDYADIRGFRVALAKRRGSLIGSVNYQFSVATGKSATAANATPVFNLNTSTGVITTDLSGVPVRDITLNFDRTHNVIVNLAYVTGEEWGPRTFGFYPLSDLTLSTNSFFRSGRPYTSPKNPKLINGARTPSEHNTNIKLTKRFKNFFGVPASFYVEVFNLFNNKFLNYDYIFSTPNLASPNVLIAGYENYPIDDRTNGILYWWDKDKQGPFAVDQSFLIYGNAPRSIHFGFVIEL